jgi:hypothetical protein
LLYNAPAKVTSNWFATHERAYATMIGTSANTLGIAIGFLLPSLFIHQYYAAKDYTQEELD